jgi:phosphohistidine phosphatase SixA
MASTDRKQPIAGGGRGLHGNAELHQELRNDRCADASKSLPHVSTFDKICCGEFHEFTPLLAMDPRKIPPMKTGTVLAVLALGWLSMPGSIGNAQPLQEDCLPFSPGAITVKKVNNSWKIVEGNQWLMDFANQEAEARQALKIIQAYGYNETCYVGRPGPSMTYYRMKPAVTTVFVVRHAEKENCPTNQDKTCPLTADGEKRAVSLARILNHSGVTVVYSTDTTRTRETVNNYATAKGISLTPYSDPATLAQAIRSTDAGRAILVAGHSPTVPMILAALGISNAPPIGDSYDNLFVVTIRPDGKASVLRLNYPIDHTLY